MSFHALATGADVHAINAATYATITARNADTNFQVSTNIDKVVKVESPLNFYILESVGPTVWLDMGSNDQDLNQADDVTFNSVTTAAALLVGGTSQFNGAALFESNVQIQGDLSTHDTTLTLNNVTVPTDLNADGGGIILKGTTDKTILWDDTLDVWKFNVGILATGDIEATNDLISGNDVTSVQDMLSGRDVTSFRNMDVGADLAVGGDILSDANNNSFLGSGVGANLANGTDNILLGKDADVSLASASNEAHLGSSGAILSTFLYGAILVEGDFFVEGDYDSDPSSNLALGTDAANDITPGGGASANIAIGTTASFKATAASYNVSIGHAAMYNNVASEVTAIGAFALAANTSGTDNVAVGSNTLRLNVGGNGNMGMGSYALHDNISGDNNTAVGARAGFEVTGSYNTMIGHLAGSFSTTGANNIIIGANLDLPNPTDSFTAIIGGDIMDKTLLYGRTGINMDPVLGQLSVKGSMTRLMTGTHSITFNFPTITGVGSLYQSEVEVGEQILFDNVAYQIIAIASNTSMTVHIDAAASASGLPMWTDTALLVLETRLGGIVLEVTPDGDTTISGDLGVDNLNVGGNIGIGTQPFVPEQMLHLKKNVAGSVRFKVENPGTDAQAQAGWELKQGNSSWVQYVIQNKGNQLNFWSTTAAQDILILKTNGDMDLLLGDLLMGAAVVLTNVSLGQGILASSLTSVGTLTDLTVAGDVINEAYTALGADAPLVKQKMFVATSPAAASGTLDTAHAIADDKIISIHATIKAVDGDFIVADHSLDAIKLYSVRWDNTNIKMKLSSGSTSQIWSRPVTYIVTYKS